MIKLLSVPGLLLVGALSFMAVPATDVAATECGGYGGQECFKNESCISVIFFKMCSTRTQYWNVF